MASSSTPPAPALDIPLHVRYIQNLDQRKDLAYHMTEHLRLNGVYWGLTALHTMGHPDALPRDEMVEYVLSCWDDEAGTFGAHPGHDGHILGTLSGIQILLMQDAIERCDVDRIVEFLLARVSPNGSVSGDAFGETDTRFTYILLSSLTLLGRISALDETKREKIIDNLQRSLNFDGGFGREPGGESHGGQVWVCVAALAILGRLDIVDQEMLGWWLSERQLPNGGLNGRPEKLEDVCYSWWDLASLSILHKVHWINKDKLIHFILSAQDLEGGGIADRPGDWVDVFHTIFGVAGLSLLGYPDLEAIDPIFCMPAKVMDRLGIKINYTTLPRQISS
ncbi:geranylgeranyl transferase type-2 subunit beta, partial [Tremellales sp. Uapishka_1]